LINKNNQQSIKFEIPLNTLIDEYDPRVRFLEVLIEKKMMGDNPQQAELLNQQTHGMQPPDPLLAIFLNHLIDPKFQLKMIILVTRRTRKMRFGKGIRMI